MSIQQPVVTSAELASGGVTVPVSARWHASFGGFDLDSSRFELRRDGVVVHLEPQAFDVLAHLVRHRHRVVSKEELLDEVWGSRFVSESALTSRIKHVRRALGDDGRAQRCIRTVHGRGYRFAPPTPVLVTAADRKSAERVPGMDQAGRHLPAERTPLLGREAALSEVADAVTGQRLVSLLGIGGVGKTRLATAAGHRCSHLFPDGVWFADLESCDDVRAVEAAIADAAGLQPAADARRGWLAEALGPHRTLLVLDNAEHVRDELAATVDALLERTSGPRFLVTSRVPLGLPDERRVPVPPLGCGGPDAPAAQLLRAAAERFGVPLGERDRPAVRRIGHLLGGRPLAVELAAAQLRVHSPADLAGRLGRGQVELRHAHRSGPDRHASLASALETTWALLDATESDLLARLAAAPGSCTLADAELLADGLPPVVVAETLARLVDLSLVRVAAGRFRLLELVRRLARHRPPGLAVRTLPPAADGARTGARTTCAHPPLPRRAEWTGAAG